jgi:hypothetical protein
MEHNDRCCALRVNEYTEMTATRTISTLVSELTTPIGAFSTQCSCKAADKPYLRWFHRGSKMAESILVAISLLGIAAAAGFGVRELMDT